MIDCDGVQSMKSKDSINRVIQVSDINIGENIRRLREAKSLKQTDLVKKLQVNGVDLSVYSYNRIEKGTQNPTVSFLLTICKLLDCDMNTLFSERDSPTKK